MTSSKDLHFTWKRSAQGHQLFLLFQKFFANSGSMVVQCSTLESVRRDKTSYPDLLYYFDVLREHPSTLCLPLTMKHRSSGGSQVVCFLVGLTFGFP